MEIMDFNPTVEHISRKSNVVADLLSRMNFQQSFLESLAMEDFPLATQYIRTAQLADSVLKSHLLQLERDQHPGKNEFESNENQSSEYCVNSIENNVVMCKKDSFQMIIPQNLRKDILVWAHDLFGHPGQGRMYNTLKSYIYWTGLQQDIKEFVKKCHICQTGKQNKKNYGKLHKTTIDMDINPFQVVAIDVVGPLSSVSEDDGIVFTHILTIIDIKTRFIELVALTNTSGLNIANTVDNVWLNRYPRPECILTDQGKNLIGTEMEELFQSYGIKHLYTTVYNPQCNSIIERAHSTLKEHLRTSGGVENNWHTKLSAIAWFMRVNYHSSLGTSPGNLVFQRDMIIPSIPSNIDNVNLNTRRFKELDRENRKRIDFKYKINGYILLENSRRASKFDPPWLGPFIIVDVPINANYLIIRRESGVLEKVNYRRIIPYYPGEYSIVGQNVVSQMHNTDASEAAPIKMCDGATIKNPPMKNKDDATSLSI
eukprot:NODE_335_length_9311_cov_0.760313.p1 type:complete len:485 gc:universal NODE_335_length_9311_cov_0.760313:7947-6493(-)